MSGVTLNLDVDSAEVERMLDGVRLRMSRDRIPMFLDNVVANYLRQRVDERFRDEGDDVVGKWAQLRKATTQIRKSQGYGAAHPINRRGGALYRYVRSYRVQQSNSTLTMPYNRGAGKLTNKKLLVAQAGGFAPRISTPGPPSPVVPRPVLGINERDADAITTKLQRWIMEGGV
jgi:hypothetical protein